MVASIINLEGHLVLDTSGVHSGWPCAPYWPECLLYHRPHVPWIGWQVGISVIFPAWLSANFLVHIFLHFFIDSQGVQIIHQHRHCLKKYKYKTREPVYANLCYVDFHSKICNLLGTMRLRVRILSSTWETYDQGVNLSMFLWSIVLALHDGCIRFTAKVN